MKRFLLEIDGGAWGNPGEAGAGVLIVYPDGQEEEHQVYLGRATNNVAEYAALLAGLLRLLELGAEEVEIVTDSQLLANQLNGSYRVRAPHLKPLFARAQAYLARFARTTVRHIPREANRRADRLATQAILERCSTLPSPLAP
ncbi:MAG: ribonuclease HI family protein [Thermoanaerobaculum sp.]|nr:ribonuclease HI family protein [Thermoanaerobaculum sp.]MDW7968521.1 ribonuclease HI family protein [Thermoanaerobaculum sp.]